MPSFINWKRGEIDYDEVIQYIARNDFDGHVDKLWALDIDHVKTLVSVEIIARMMQKSVEEVAKDVVMFRIMHDILGKIK